MVPHSTQKSDGCVFIGSSGELWEGRSRGIGMKFHKEEAAVRIPRPSPTDSNDSHCLLCLNEASSAMLGG